MTSDAPQSYFAWLLAAHTVAFRVSSKAPRDDLLEALRDNASAFQSIILPPAEKLPFSERSLLYATSSRCERLFAALGYSQFGRLPWRLHEAVAGVAEKIYREALNDTDLDPDHYLQLSSTHWSSVIADLASRQPQRMCVEFLIESADDLDQSQVMIAEYLAALSGLHVALGGAGLEIDDAQLTGLPSLVSSV